MDSTPIPINRQLACHTVSCDCELIGYWIYLPTQLTTLLVLSEGKAAAASRDCKFIETSSGIQHNVDELLVGILKQCRLKETRDKKEKRKNGKFARLHGSRTSLSLNVARELLQRICLNDSKSKSCENLHVL